jgi:hypothetical protein
VTAIIARKAAIFLIGQASARLMLGAVLVDRPALSLRNLALAALISLVREPEGLLGPLPARGRGRSAPPAPGCAG